MSQIERSAGWKRNTLANTVGRGSLPNASAAIQLARALNVPAEWLFDDAQTWPPTTSPLNSMDKVAILRAMSDALRTAADQLDLDRRHVAGEAIKGAADQQRSDELRQ